MGATHTHPPHGLTGLPSTPVPHTTHIKQALCAVLKNCLCGCLLQTNMTSPEESAFIEAHLEASRSIQISPTLLSLEFLHVPYLDWCSVLAARYGGATPVLTYRSFSMYLEALYPQTQYHLGPGASRGRRGLGTERGKFSKFAQGSS